MGSRGYLCMVLLVFVLYYQLSAQHHYDQSCPNALNTIKRVVEAAVQSLEWELPCFVYTSTIALSMDVMGHFGLDATPSIDSEKNAFGSLNSSRGFEVIDEIKKEVLDQSCGGSVVSGADILAVAASDCIF